MRPEAAAAIDRVLRDAADRGDVPGIVALATTAEGTVYQGAFGHRSVDGAAAGAAMTLDTVFALASMTKALTSVAAMQLVEQGRLSLDGPIGAVVPQLAALPVLHGFAADGAPVLRPATRPMTLRHLLTHTAGYGYTTWNAELVRWAAYTGEPNRPGDWEAVQRHPLLFEPGTRWNYGINTDLVGKVVEAVGGLPLDGYLNRHVLGPLGMHDTAVVLSGEQRARQAGLHLRAPDGTLSPIRQGRGQGASFFMGGGALCGTGPDYLRFLHALLNGGGGVLRPGTVAEMARNHIGDLVMEPMRSTVPQTSADAEFFQGMPKQWGLGFMINAQDAPTGRRAGSGAWAGLANTYFWLDWKAGVAGVLLMQLFPFADPLALGVFTAFERAVYDALGGTAAA